MMKVILAKVTGCMLPKTIKMAKKPAKITLLNKMRTKWRKMKSITRKVLKLFSKKTNSIIQMLQKSMARM